LIVSLRYFNPKGEKSKYLIRKSVHLITGLVIFYLTFSISRQTLLILFIGGTIFSFVSYFIKKLNYIHVTRESSWGTLFYPLGILSSFILLYEMPLYYFQVSLLFLTISDTVANIGGFVVKGNPQFSILNEKKTPLGITGFAITAFLISLVILPESDWATMLYMLLAVVCAIHFEIISFKGSDNLTIPLGTALFFFVTHGKSISSVWIIAVILVMAPISMLLYRAGILSRKGALLAHLLGIYLFGILGIDWGLPVAFFFVTSVIFTKINGIVNRKLESAGNRNMSQVAANIFAGLVFSIVFLISSQLIFIYLFIAALAAVTADTWASEIGPVFQKKCFSLSAWRTVRAGTSGGISVVGTLAACTGAILLSMVAWAGFFPQMNFQKIIILAVSGFLASFVDSALGAFLEPCLDKMKYFKKENESESISANDLVNLLASFSAPLFFLLLNYFIR
jgi:uncharacterized protein (TIGR00297 family)